MASAADNTIRLLDRGVLITKFLIIKAIINIEFVQKLHVIRKYRGIFIIKLTKMFKSSAVMLVAGTHISKIFITYVRYDIAFLTNDDGPNICNIRVSIG